MKWSAPREQVLPPDRLSTKLDSVTGTMSCVSAQGSALSNVPSYARDTKASAQRRSSTVVIDYVARRAEKDGKRADGAAAAARACGKAKKARLAHRSLLPLRPRVAPSPSMQRSNESATTDATAASNELARALPAAISSTGISASSFRNQESFVNEMIRAHQEGASSSTEVSCDQSVLPPNLAVFMRQRTERQRQQSLERATEPITPKQQQQQQQQSDKGLSCGIPRTWRRSSASADTQGPNAPGSQLNALIASGTKSERSHLLRGDARPSGSRSSGAPAAARTAGLIAAHSTSRSSHFSSEASTSFRLEATTVPLDLRATDNKSTDLSEASRQTARLADVVTEPGRLRPTPDTWTPQQQQPERPFRGSSAGADEGLDASVPSVLPDLASLPSALAAVIAARKTCASGATPVAIEMEEVKTRGSVHAHQLQGIGTHSTVADAHDLQEDNGDEHSGGDDDARCGDDSAACSGSQHEHMVTKTMTTTMTTTTTQRGTTSGTELFTRSRELDVRSPTASSSTGHRSAGSSARGVTRSAAHAERPREPAHLQEEAFAPASGASDAVICSPAETTQSPSHDTRESRPSSVPRLSAPTVDDGLQVVTPTHSSQASPTAASTTDSAAAAYPAVADDTITRLASAVVDALATSTSPLRSSPRAATRNTTAGKQPVHASRAFQAGDVRASRELFAAAPGPSEPVARQRSSEAAASAPRRGSAVCPAIARPTLAPALIYGNKSMSKSISFERADPSDTLLKSTFNEAPSAVKQLAAQSATARSAAAVRSVSAGAPLPPRRRTTVSAEPPRSPPRSLSVGSSVSQAPRASSSRGPSPLQTAVPQPARSLLDTTASDHGDGMCEVHINDCLDSQPTQEAEPLNLMQYLAFRAIRSRRADGTYSIHPARREDDNDNDDGANRSVHVCTQEQQQEEEEGDEELLRTATSNPALLSGRSRLDSRRSSKLDSGHARHLNFSDYCTYRSIRPSRLASADRANSDTGANFLWSTAEEPLNSSSHAAPKLWTASDVPWASGRDAAARAVAAERTRAQRAGECRVRPARPQPIPVIAAAAACTSDSAWARARARVDGVSKRPVQLSCSEEAFELLPMPPLALAAELKAEAKASHVSSSSSARAPRQSTTACNASTIDIHNAPSLQDELARMDLRPQPSRPNPRRGGADEYPGGMRRRSCSVGKLAQAQAPQRSSSRGPAERRRSHSAAGARQGHTPDIPPPHNGVTPEERPKDAFEAVSARLAPIRTKTTESVKSTSTVATSAAVAARPEQTPADPRQSKAFRSVDAAKSISNSTLDSREHSELAAVAARRQTLDRFTNMSRQLAAVVGAGRRSARSAEASWCSDDSDRLSSIDERSYPLSAAMPSASSITELEGETERASGGPAARWADPAPEISSSAEQNGLDEDEDDAPIAPGEEAFARAFRRPAATRSMMRSTRAMARLPPVAEKHTGSLNSKEESETSKTVPLQQDVTPATSAAPLRTRQGGASGRRRGKDSSFWGSLCMCGT